jgi:hypothetical protein
MRILLSVSILLATILTTAPAALPEQAFIAIKPIASENLGSINSIGLLKIPDMGTYALRRGDIGLEIFVGDYFDDILRPLEYDNSTKEFYGYNFSRVTAESLKDELRFKNYNVVQLTADRNNRNRFLDNYDGLDNQEIDAYLDVIPQVIGYYRPDREMLDGVIYDFHPFYLYVSVNVQLVDAGTKQILYRDRVTYRSSTTTASGRATSSSGTVLYSTDDRRFDNPQELRKNAEIALDQLTEKIQTVMQEIARKISKTQ